MKFRDWFQRGKEEIRLDREKMQGKPLRKKIQYFFMYYKIPFFLTIAVILAVFSIVHTLRKDPDYSFCAIFVNAEYADGNDEAMEEEFVEYSGIDTSQSEVHVYSAISFGLDDDSSLSSANLEIFESYIFSNSMDACVLSEDLFETYAGLNAFQDLSEVLTQEEMERYGDYLVYVDEVPYGVDIAGFAVVEEYGLYAEDGEAVYSVLYNAPNEDYGGIFLDYLFEGVEQTQ